jgi:hypothetical protein
MVFTLMFLGFGLDVAASEGGSCALYRERRGFGAGAMAFFSGSTGRTGRWLGETPAGPGVIELEEVAIVVFGGEDVIGREVDVGSIGAGADQAGRLLMGGTAMSSAGCPNPRGDEMRTTLDELINILTFVGVPGKKRF